MCVYVSIYMCVLECMYVSVYVCVYVYVHVCVCGGVISVCHGTCMCYLYPLSYLASLSQVLAAMHKLCCPFDSVIKGVPMYAEDDSPYTL